MPEDVEVLTPEEQKLPNEVQAQLRIARKTERENSELKAQMARMEKQAAIDKAGVPEHPAREVVFATYDGPLESDAIREYAAKMGIVAQAPSGVSDQERAAMGQILNAGNGNPPNSSDIDAAIAMRNAKSPQEVWAVIDQVAGTPGFRNSDGLIGVRPEY